MLFNVIFSAIIATNYFEPVATKVTETFPSFTYLWDFLSLWGLFVLSALILRAVTDGISKTKVRFKLPLEQGGENPLRLPDRLGHGLFVFVFLACRAAQTESLRWSLR